MCIRYQISGDHLVDWSEQLGEWSVEENLKTEADTFPGYEAPILTPGGKSAESQIRMAKWGLVPFWTKDSKFGIKNAYNARNDSLGPTPKDTKQTWREPFFKRRCIVPATAFFERTEIGTPAARWMRFSDPRHGLLAVAGLFEEPNELTAGRPTFAMVTTEPTEVVETIHDRMPVVLSIEDAKRWLDPATEPSDLLKMLQPCPSDWLQLEPELTLKEHREMTK